MPLFPRSRLACLAVLLGLACSSLLAGSDVLAATSGAVSATNTTTMSFGQFEITGDATMHVYIWDQKHRVKTELSTDTDAKSATKAYTALQKNALLVSVATLKPFAIAKSVDDTTGTPRASKYAGKLLRVRGDKKIWFVNPDGSNRWYFDGSTKSYTGFFLAKVVGTAWLKAFMAAAKTSNTTQPPAKTIAFTVLERGMYVGPQKNGSIQVIKTQADLQTLWSGLYPDAATRPAVPSTDFSHKSIVVGYGQKDVNTVDVSSVEASGVTMHLGTPQIACSGIPTAHPFEVVETNATAIQTASVSYTEVNSQPCLPVFSDADVTYTNAKYQVSLQLLDALKYFTVTESTSSQPEVLALLTFSQHSRIDNADHVVFSIVVSPNSQWSVIQKAGGISCSHGTDFCFQSVSKIGSNDQYTFAKISGDFRVPDDIGDYTFQDIHFVPFKG